MLYVELFWLAKILLINQKKIIKRKISLLFFSKIYNL